MIPRIRIFILVTILLFVYSFDALGMSCEGVNAEVFTADIELSSSVCFVAKKTANFMQTIGFDTSFPLHITVSKSLKSLHLAPVYGLYNSHEKRIEIVDLASHLSEHHSKKPFGIEMNQEIHQSFIAHEISHAYTQANAPKSGLSLVAHEYIAYIVQFSLLPKSVRSEILRNYHVLAFENENEISALYFYLNPEYFAVKSWRHQISLENGKSFIKGILQGENLKVNND